MSKLGELIKELCPNGVEYKAIEAVTTMHRGIRVVKRNLEADGLYPVYQNSLTPLGYMKEKNCDAGTTFVIAAGAAGEVGFSSIDFWAADDCYYFDNNELLDGCYLYHVLLSKQYYLFSQVRKASIPRLGRGIIEKMIIPVPPLEIQHEIVHILDNFMELTTELTTELTARKKQYEFYRNQLLTMSKCSGEVLPLGKIIHTLKTGLNPRQNFKLNESGADYYYVTGKDVYDNAIHVSEKTDKIASDVVALINKRACLQDDILLFVSTGTGTVGRMAVIDKYDGTWNVSETIYCIKTTDRVLSKYLMYFLYSTNAREQFEPKISKGSVPHLKVSDLLNVKIPVPTIDTQKKLVRVLDNFDSICSDLNIGLPAEIEARQKQYEYYRDKLLTFKELRE
ncbi:MAG: hypothetical protein HDR11_04865 [Lachnospiraceae bacterium]|nr:hypothetical protein [Lachnospiraceae bacterium]